MNFRELWTTFEGRVGRYTFMVGTIVLFCLIAVAYIAVESVAVFLYTRLVGPLPSLPIFLSFLPIAILAYPWSALLVKRLHDRNRSPMLVVAFWASALVWIGAQIAGVASEVSTANGREVAIPTALGWIVGGVHLLISCWTLTEAMILKGTEGSNRYGPDPLAPEPQT